MEQERLQLAEEKRQAWRKLGWSLLWCLLLLLGIVALGWGIAVFGDAMSEGLRVFLILVVLAFALNLAFLYPVFFAAKDLFVIYVGRPLWRYPPVRALVWLWWAVVLAAIAYQFFTDDLVLEMFSGGK